MDPNPSMQHPILAIDYGDSRIGTAVSDMNGILAHPLETIFNNSDAMGRITQLIETREIRGILIGLPLRMDGSEGNAALKIRHFKNQLIQFLPYKIPVKLVDERMTTQEASAKLSQAGLKAKHQKNVIDQAAAIEILNRYIQSYENPFGLLQDPDTIS